MAAKNEVPNNESKSKSIRKKPRPGFKIGPDNLPDGTYRRKAVKIKKELIQKAKIKKSYAKLKAREAASTTPTFITSASQNDCSAASQEVHPDRQAMLNAPEQIEAPSREEQQFSHKRHHRSKKPSYFEKEQAFAEKKKQEKEAQKLQFDRQAMERARKLEERERFRKAMAKARIRGPNGQRKLGRESAVLLEKIKRSFQESKN
ncbi:hypothetical protein OnM2_045038 [Erysiphe neolycopersici]|uniref:rRNA-processing protein FYV7 n=1 Tax=Erysiphe neolycopersici TaxID=212602 RepID=A0A420HUC9_9PEZI|nr:hypothetical protein OnM2_045038 [Erysiphe neolycopersici]